MATKARKANPKLKTAKTHPGRTEKSPKPPMAKELKLFRRPRIYETPDELQLSVEAYLEDRVVPRVEKALREIHTYDDKLKKQVKEIKEVDVLYPGMRPTLVSFCYFAGISRSALLEYGKREEFKSTVEMIKTLCEATIEELMILGGGGQATGLVFALKNNHGWIDETIANLKNNGGSFAGELTEEARAAIDKANRADRK